MVGEVDRHTARQHASGHQNAVSICLPDESWELLFPTGNIIPWRVVEDDPLGFRGECILFMFLFKNKIILKLVFLIWKSLGPPITELVKLVLFSSRTEAYTCKRVNSQRQLVLFDAGCVEAYKCSGDLHHSV